MKKVRSAKKVSYIGNYMNQFYGSLTPENRIIGQFLRRASTAAMKNRLQRRRLDLACGPSAFYWALFVKLSSAYCGLDARQESIDYLGKLIANVLVGKVERRYLEVAESRPNSNPSSAKKFVTAVANHWQSYTTADIENVLPFDDGSFEEVVSCFGVDHVSTAERFRFALAEARRVLVPGGQLTLATLCDTDSWRCGNTMCACLKTTEESLRADLEKLGYKVISLKKVLAITAMEEDHGYNAMLFCTAVRS